MGLANNYKGITLTSIAAKVYYSLLLNIQPEIKKYFANQNGFGKEIKFLSNSNSK